VVWYHQNRVSTRIQHSYYNIPFPLLLPPLPFPIPPPASSVNSDLFLSHVPIPLNTSNR
jgi:hypothetical protein